MWILACLAPLGSEAGSASQRSPPASEKGSDDRLVTFENLDGVGDLSVGTTISVNQAGLIAAEKNGRLVVIDGRKRSLIASLGEGLAPRWSPSGKRLGFYSLRSGQLQLWMWTRETGELTQLTRFPEGVDPDPGTRINGFTTDALHFSWSPDETRIVFASRVAVPSVHQRTREPLVLTNATPPNLTLRGVFTRPTYLMGGVPRLKNGRTFGFRAARDGEDLFSQLFILDTATNVTTQLTEGRRIVFHPEWSPDGAMIAAAAATSRYAEEGASASLLDDGGDTLRQIILIDPRTREERSIAGGTSVKHSPRWSRDGLRLGYLAAEQLWGTYSLITYDVQAGALLPSGTSDAADRTVWKFDWVATSHELITQSFSRDWELRHRKSGGAERPIVTRDFVGQWSLGPDGALAWMDGDLVRYLPSRGRRASIVFDFRAGTSRPRLAEVEEFVWRSEHASEYAGELLRPPPDKCTSRCPLIVDAYPGATGWMEPINANQAWAAMGYVVFKPRPPAPHVWMNASAGTSATKQGPDVWKTTVDVVLSGVDALARQNLIDPHRACLYGHSNGGGVVAYLVTQTTAFKCAVVVAPGMADWVRPSLLLTDDRSIEIAAGGRTLADNPADYLRLSAVFHLHKSRTPMLIAAGDEDGDFLLNAIEIYNQLRKAGTEVKLIRYPDQSHILEGEAMRHFWREEMEFFNRFLIAK